MYNIIITIIAFILPIIHNAPRDLSATLELIYSSGNYALEITIGTPPQSFECYISTVLPKLYLPVYSSFVNLIKSTSQSVFEPHLSSTFTKENSYPIPLHQLSSKGYISTDKLTFSFKHSLNQFQFITLTEGHNIGKTFSCSVGFEYLVNEANDNSFSIINSLYSSGQIYIRVFYIIKNQHDSSFSIGKYPPNFLEFSHRHQFKKCSLVASKTHPYLWQCHLNAIYFSNMNDVIEINKALTWSFGGNVNCVNEEFYNVMKEKYFKSALSMHDCHEVFESERIHLDCNSRFEINGDPTINYVFGKWNMKFKLNELFVAGDYSRKWFGIMKCKEGHLEFNWSIGLFHIKKGTFLFDKEKQLFAYSELID